MAEINNEIGLSRILRAESSNTTGTPYETLPEKGNASDHSERIQAV